MTVHSTFNTGEPQAYFLTWTTYGTWLPGGERGWNRKGGREILPPNALFVEMAQSHLKEPPFTPSAKSRTLVEETIRRHCGIRGWALHALNVRTNHAHVVVIRALIEAAREQTARAVNSALVGLYWDIGKRIREGVLDHKRAEYGQQIVNALSSQLTVEYGRGFERRNLYYLVQFAAAFTDEVIVSALRRELSWTRFKEIIYLDNPLKRDFYAEMCRIERFSTRTLRHKIGHLLFERTAVSKKPDDLIAADIAALRDEDRMTPDLVFRDPYCLDFLGLTGLYAEKGIHTPTNSSVGAIDQRIRSRCLEAV